MSELHDCRNAFQQTLVELAVGDERIVAVVNDSVGSSKLDAFEKAYPGRTINVGIAEQNMAASVPDSPTAGASRSSPPPPRS